MATKNNRPLYSKEVTLLIAIYTLLFSNCYSFRNGYRKFYSNQQEKAAKIFEKKIDHRIWSEGAIAYREFIKLDSSHTLTDLKKIDSTLCSVSKKLYNMPNSRKKEKLNKYRINLLRLDTVLLNTQKKAIEAVRVSGRISGLDTLLEHFPCWQHQDSLEIFATNMVNIKISDSSRMVSWPKNCYLFFPPTSWNISYDDATRIIDNHIHRVKPENLEKFWALEQNIWAVFRDQSPPYCNMDRFREDHPDHPFTLDPWYDTACRALCNDSLKIALDFHRKNPYSVFDDDICNHILCLYNLFPSDKTSLSEAELQHVEDINTMAVLETEMCGGTISDTTLFFRKLEDLSRKYHQHDVVFNLVAMAVNLYLQREQPKMAMELLKRLYPYFVDPKVSSPIEYKLQKDKQAWFQQYVQIIDETTSEPNKHAEPITEWNTEENDEFSAVSWGDGYEVYFVRRDRRARINQIMCSIYDSDRNSWSAPFLVEGLSFSPDVEPVSISNNGLWLLLRSGGKIWQSRRPYSSWTWSRPEPLSLDLPYVTWASFTPDNNFLMIEGISDLNWLRKDIFLCKMAPNGQFVKSEKLKTPVNSDFYNDTYPIVTAGGRRLYMASDKPGGMGGADNYVISLPEILNFTSSNISAIHLGWHSNTWGDDFGFSFISEYTGKGYFHRPNLCGHNIDIFQINMLPVPRKDAFENTCDPIQANHIQTNHILCFAGVVLDENRKPIPGDKGSFIEFITDYNLNVAKQMVSKNGTYFYTAPSQARAVRLFPEVPGYYSERDTTYFPALLSEDQTIRDTFILQSFDFLRKNSTLEYGTFLNKTAEFDDKDRVYPELVRLAKIARRMGAELVLMGHTDNTGTEAENQALSEQRAEAVRSFLINICGFDGNKITTIGFGAKKPKRPNDTEEGRRCNRRIEIVFKMPELPDEESPSIEASTHYHASPASKN